MSSFDNPQVDSQRPVIVPPAAEPPALVDTTPPAGIPGPFQQLSEDPPWNGWDVAVIALLTVGSSFLLQIIVGLLGKRFVYTDDGLLDVVKRPMVGLIAELLAYALVATFMVMLVEGKYHVPFWPSIQWNWPRPFLSQLGYLGLGVLVLFSVGILQKFLPVPKSTPFDEYFARPLDAYLTSLFAVALGPLMEELFFRGFMYPVLARRLGVVWGIFFTALPFGLIHAIQYGYSWAIVLLIFLMGAVCTAVRASTKSVAASFLVHVGYNGAQLLGLAIVTGGFRHMDKVGWLRF